MKSHTPSTELACFAYGTGSADEGVTLLLQLGVYRVLLDCGIWTVEPLLADLPSVDFVWCSHAHPDHTRGLRHIHEAFPHLPIFASEVTRRLLPLDRGSEQDTFDWVKPLPWRSQIELKPGLSVSLFPAGHLPGAAILRVSYTPSPDQSSSPNHPYTVVYTGDMSLSGMRFVEGLPLDELRNLRPDALIVEGSYGTARYPRRRQLENQFVECVFQAIQSGRSVLLPVSEMGMGAEILILLRSHHRFTGQAIDIWVDAALARSCDAYLDLLPEFPANVQNFARYQPLFWDDRIRPFVKHLPTQPGAIAESITHPCILLVSHTTDWQAYYQENSLPWLVLLSEKPGRSQPLAVDKPLAPQVQQETYFLTEHCDLAGTLQVVHTLRPQHVVLMHGSPSYLADLSSLDELSNRYQLHIPSVGNWVELPIGEAFYQPAPPENRYEGEVTVLHDLVQLSLPPELTLDSRWVTFANTGLVDIRWQGDELVLKGISPQDLLNRETQWNRPEFDQRPVCGTCRYYHGQHCRNLDSPMAGLKVTQDGYCPMYEAVL
jgi:Cft2 family RNA processing exonuclease